MPYRHKIITLIILKQHISAIALINLNPYNIRVSQRFFPVNARRNFASQKFLLQCIIFQQSYQNPMYHRHLKHH